MKKSISAKQSKTTKQLLKNVHHAIEDIPKNVVDCKSISRLMSSIMTLCIDRGLAKLDQSSAKDLMTVGVMIYDKFLHAPPQSLQTVSAEIPSREALKSQLEHLSVFLKSKPTIKNTVGDSPVSNGILKGHLEQEST